MKVQKNLKQYNLNMKNKSHFSAIVQLKDGFEDQIDVTLDKKATDLTYDEVYDAICNAVDAEYMFSTKDFETEDDSPYNIVDIVINEDGESYPVISDSDDVEQFTNSGY